MKRFIEMKRHLHSILLVLNLIFVNLFVYYDWMQFAQIGIVGVCCIVLGADAIVAFSVEAYQAIVKGANRTPAEMLGAKWDMATSIISGAIGLVLYYVFGLAYWSALIFAGIIALMELYRRKVILKKDGAK